MVTASEVAKYLLTLSKPNTDKSITHLKLQKLVYYAQAWHLTLYNNEPLFNEKIEAWIHGPVCTELYYEYKKHGFQVIEPYKGKINIPQKSKELIDDVWEAYGSFSGGYLEQLTHKEEPWIQARGILKDNQLSNNEISWDSMVKFYRNQQ